MSWGNEPVAAPAAPVAVLCEHPEHNGNAVAAVVYVEVGSEGERHKVASCEAHSEGETIVGIVEGDTGVAVSESITKRLIAQWDYAKDVMARAKESEMEARLLVGNYAIPIAGRKEGVNNLELSDGPLVKLGHKVNYKLVGDNDKIDAAEIACEAIGNEGAFLVERIITWKADISVGEYKKLDKDNPTHMKVKAEIDKVLEISNGTPSLEVREPKAKLNG